MKRIIDLVALWLMAWALRRFYGADCETYVWDDFAGEPYEAECLSCDAKFLIQETRELLEWQKS